MLFDKVHLSGPCILNLRLRFMMFKDKIVVISGSNSGIGKTLSKEYIDKGAIVHGFDITNAKNSDKYYAHKVDVRNFENIKKSIVDVLEKSNRIDIVVNCAGGSSARVLNENVSFEKLSIEAINWGIDVNLRGPVYMARACINQMIKQKSGVIINIGSISGETGSSTAVDYSSAKSGLVGLTKSLALLGANYGIRCCMVTPGPVLTRPEMSKMPTPLNRAAEVQEIADLILYLTSDKAGFITGSNYLIDGGRSCGGIKHAK